MPPFSKANQLVRDLEGKAEVAVSDTLPGRPSVMLKDANRIRQFLEKEFCSEDLEIMAPRLWIMTTFSSANINPLHRQRVKGREIVITEEPRLHLVWIHHRIFVKPLPRYLLSHEFWEIYLDRNSDANRLGNSQSDIRRAATGFLRTYLYLIQHESDFNIAQEMSLIPKEVDWPSFCLFVSELDDIEDFAVSTRYCYGELRLTRLNFYAPFLLRKFYFEHIYAQYGEFFSRLYGPILFAFAIVSTILNSMQVALAAEQLVAVHWDSFLHVSLWFSIVSLVGAAIISLWFVLLWLWLFTDEWVFTVRRKMEKKRETRTTSSC